MHRLATGKRPRASVTQRVGRWAGLYSRRVKSKRTCQAGCGRGSSPKTYTHDMEPRRGAKHLLLGPPRRFAIVGNSDAARLNAHLWHLAQHKNVSARYAEGNVLVQPVSSCPSSSCVLLGCYRNKLESFRMDLAAFLEQVHDKARFMHALEQNVRSVNTMVRETTCLRTDFQILVRNDGQIFHLDLDRCFAHGRHTWAEDCLDNALALISTISTNNSDWYGRNGSRLLR